MIQNHEIDHRIFGEEMQYVELELDPNESAIAEPGAFMMMDDGISMETIFGDGSQQQSGGLFGKLLNAGKRVLVGESLFMTAFTNTGQGKKRVSFASPYPGKIIPLNLQQLGNRIICQKDAFLCAAKGVSVGIEFQRKLGAGLFGGEGFIMEKLEGDGMAFLHAGESVVSVAGFRLSETLAWGRFLYVDDLVTLPDYRSKGYGSELLTWLKKYAIEAGCLQLHLDSGIQRKEAHRFYEREGMTLASFHFIENIGSNK